MWIEDVLEVPCRNKLYAVVSLRLSDTHGKFIVITIHVQSPKSILDGRSMI
jgi:hypothetical protein